MKKVKRLALLTAAVLLSFVFALDAAATTYERQDDLIVGNKYYLAVEIDGEEYYYRHTKSGESVTNTTPYSLYLTNDPDDTDIKELSFTALGGGFSMGFNNSDKYISIYSYDVGNDGAVDTGGNSSAKEGQHDFYFDVQTGYIYRTIGGAQYVLSAQKLYSSKSGVEEWRMLCVPVEEVTAENGVYPMYAAVMHFCTFSEDWASDEYSHYHLCNCGEKKAVALHQIDEWTITKEAGADTQGSKTGVCTLCAAQVTEVIPAENEWIQETVAIEAAETAEQEEITSGIDPVGLAGVAALALAGVAILIFGKKTSRKEKN